LRSIACLLVVGTLCVGCVTTDKISYVQVTSLAAAAKTDDPTQRSLLAAIGSFNGARDAVSTMKTELQHRESGYWWATLIIRALEASGAATAAIAGTLQQAGTVSSDRNAVAITGAIVGGVSVIVQEVWDPATYEAKYSGLLSQLQTQASQATSAIADPAATRPDELQKATEKLTTLLSLVGTSAPTLISVNPDSAPEHVRPYVADAAKGFELNLDTARGADGDAKEAEKVCSTDTKLLNASWA